MTWQPIPPDKCGECGRYTPGWYDKRDQDVADAYESGISSRRLAKAYGVAESTVFSIVVEILGQRAVRQIQRAYLTAWHEEDE